MTDEQRPRNDKKPRRFRLIRKVEPVQPKPAGENPDTEVKSRLERELEEPDDADKGTPEMDRAVREGCNGCVKVMLLFLLIMVASIVTTCAINRKGV
jgi:hypothetical protein